MPNSEKVLPCYRCGGTRFLHKLAPQHEQVFCANCYAYTHEEPIHPNRLKAENLVPASELEALVKFAEFMSVERIRSHNYDGGGRFCMYCGMMMGRYIDLDSKKDHEGHDEKCPMVDARQALAHAREILKGGKG